MLAIKELRCIYNHLESKDDRRIQLGVCAMKTIRFSDWNKVKIIFDTFKLNPLTND